MNEITNSIHTHTHTHTHKLENFKFNVVTINVSKTLELILIIEHCTVIIIVDFDLITFQIGKFLRNLSVAFLCYLYLFPNLNSILNSFKVFYFYSSFINLYLYL